VTTGRTPCGRSPAAPGVAARPAHAVHAVAAGALALALAMTPDDADAQRGGRFPGGFMRSFGDPNEFYTPPDFAGNPPYDGRFTFARIKYRGYGYWSGREGPGWSHDYPDADVHFMKIVREVTSMRPFTNSGRILGGAIVALDDPALFKYPVAYLSEPGGWFPTDAEAKGLGAYLRKGGFMIVDDFPFEAWGTFEAAMSRALPGLRAIQLTGKEPIFDSFYKVDMEKIRRGYSGGGRGPRGGAFFGYFENNDPTRRLMVLACYGQDIGESWQWSGQGFMAVDVTNEAFKLGINFVVYALTH
jgi:hypothetical protein